MDFILFGITIKEAVWVPLASALAGGVLALLGSFSATWQANRSARKTREEELERQSTERAYATFYKLFEAYNSAANLELQIEEMIENAAKSGNADMEPWAKVKELVGAPDEIGKIEPSETSFLIAEKKADLLNEVHLVQRRIANIMAAAEKYSEVRAELQAFLVANMSNGELAEGTQLAAELKGTAALHAEMLEKRANDLLGQVMDFLETDVQRSRQVASEFKDAARERFGEKFPEFKIDMHMKG